MSETEEEVVRGTWRYLKASKRWGVEAKGVKYGEDVTGRIVEVRRRDGSISRFRLAERVCERRGKLAPLYAIEKRS